MIIKVYVPDDGTKMFGIGEGVKIGDLPGIIRDINNKINNKIDKDEYAPQIVKEELDTVCMDMVIQDTSITIQGEVRIIKGYPCGTIKLICEHDARDLCNNGICIFRLEKDPEESNEWAEIKDYIFQAIVEAVEEMPGKDSIGDGEEELVFC